VAPEEKPYEGEGEAPSPRLWEILRTREGLGFASLFLGALSIPILCIPIVGYASFACSALGLVLGLAGMARSPGHAGLGAPAGGGLAPELFGVRANRFPMAGAVLCLVSLALALLPYAARSAGL
jgi:hypothetical protein